MLNQAAVMIDLIYYLTQYGTEMQNYRNFYDVVTAELEDLLCFFQIEICLNSISRTEDDVYKVEITHEPPKTKVDKV